MLNSLTLSFDLTRFDPHRANFKRKSFSRNRLTSEAVVPELRGAHAQTVNLSKRKVYARVVHNQDSTGLELMISL